MSINRGRYVRVRMPETFTDIRQGHACCKLVRAVRVAQRVKVWRSAAVARHPRERRHAPGAGGETRPGKRPLDTSLTRADRDLVSPNRRRSENVCD